MSDEQAMVRALIGDASEDEMRAHRELLLRDREYRAAFDAFRELRAELDGLPVPALPGGFAARVSEALRERRGGVGMVEVMGRQFWRVAGPALVAATLLVAFAQQRVPEAERQPATMTAWYPISVDPTDPSNRTNQ